MERDEASNPLIQVQRSLVSVRDHIGHHLQQHNERHLQPWRRGVQQQIGTWWSQTPLAQAHQRLTVSASSSSNGAHIGGRGLWAPALASVTLSATRPSSSTSTGSSNFTCSTGSTALSFSDTATTGGTGRPQALFDVAMAKEEVKARLAPIPVFTIANPKNEFVLVAGENNSQLGIFFFKKDDAEGVVDKIREENPRLARDSKILRVTMDNVFEVFTTPRDQTGLQGIHFRFMPDMKQVSHALKLYKDAGVPTRQFMGVPVFQAEGLTVTTQELQYVPLFLCKEDLDIAVQSAYRQRNAAQISMFRDKAAKLERELQQLTNTAEAASGREKAQAEALAGKARTKAEAARTKADAVEKAPLPKIEVGSFEEVMMRMSASSGSELTAWNQVMFVAPGLLQQAIVKEPVPAIKK